VPCFVRWPGHVKAGTTIKQIAAHIDVLPTLADLCGVKEPRTLPLDGQSLLPLLLNKASTWPDRMLFERGAVRTQRFRLQVSGRGRRQPGKPQLFDMVADPAQKKDVSQQHPDVTARLTKAYQAWHADVSKGLEGMPPALPVGYAEAPAVTLLAPECKMSGNVRYKQGRGWANDWITNWTSTEDRVWWDIDVVRPGRFNVALLYACPKEDVGAKLRVEAGGQAVEGVVAKAHDPEPLPSPDRVKRGEVYEKVWAPLAMGAARLAKGKTKLTVRALSKPGKQVFDLKAVRLERID
ncbi:MAG: sulfatase/phosphatase domain-containing protein, partial [Phycisphaerae bacterium]